MDSVGKITPSPDGLESKYFATTAEDAAAYAKAVFGKFSDTSPYTIIRTEASGSLVPSATVEKGLQTITLPNGAALLRF